MKNRTVIGIICIILSTALVFVAAPAASKLSEETESVYIFSENIGVGIQITEKMISETKVLKDQKPDNAISTTQVNKSDIIGKYTKANVYKGDYITKSKLTSVSNSTESVLANLKDGEVVVSMSVDMLNTVSDNIERGDIIKIFSTKKEGKNTTTTVNDLLQYVKVIATTTKKGVEGEDRTMDDDGNIDEIGTVILLMKDPQVQQLRTLQKSTTVSIGLVCKASDSDRAEKLLQAQDDIINKTKQS